MDLSPPSETEFTGQPASLTTDVNAAITISGDGIVQYKWSLDGGDWSEPVSAGTELSFSELADGQHSLSLVAQDSAGNWQTSPTVYTWTVDTTAPTASISGAPVGVTNQTWAMLQVGGSGVASYMYKLNSGSYGEWTSTAQGFVVNFLADGPNSVSVLGRDEAGNVQATPTVASWTVDTAAPTAVLSGTPAAQTTATSASITVAGSGVTLYKYKLDSGEYGAERGVGTPIALSNLGLGAHTLSVIGRDAAGNWQSSPTTHAWTVASAQLAAPTIPSSLNPSNIRTPSPTLSWTAPTGAVSYDLVVSPNQDFSSPFLELQVTATSLTLDGARTLPNKGTWYWRVRAVDDSDDTSPWASASFSYQTGVNMAPVILLLGH